MGYGEKIKSWFNMDIQEARDYISNVPYEILDIIHQYENDNDTPSPIRIARFIQSLATMFNSDRDMFEYLAAFSPHEEAA